MRKNKRIYKNTLKNKIEIVKQALKHITHTSQIYTGTNKQSNQTIPIERHDSNKKNTTHEALSPYNNLQCRLGGRLEGDSAVYLRRLQRFPLYVPSLQQPHLFLRRRWPDKTPVYLLDEYLPSAPEDRLKNTEVQPQ